MILTLARWLSSTDPLAPSDVIFVLAGRENRKIYALDLFREGFAPKILFSVARFEIRKFSRMELPVPIDLLKLAAAVPAPQRHYFVLFENTAVEVEYVRPRGFGTLTEIEALARWLHEHPKIKTVIVVSSGTHLRRVRVCCKALLRNQLGIRFIAVPETSSQHELWHAIIIEFAKTIPYCVLVRLRGFRNRTKSWIIAPDRPSK